MCWAVTHMTLFFREVSRYIRCKYPESIIVFYSKLFVEGVRMGSARALQLVCWAVTHMTLFFREVSRYNSVSGKICTILLCPCFCVAEVAQDRERGEE